MRFISLAAASLAAASILLLYAINYDTRLLEARVHAEERALAPLRAQIAVLRAERAFLARPDRIEPLARSLGLRPAEPEQFAVADDRANPEVAAGPPDGAAGSR